MSELCSVISKQQTISGHSSMSITAQALYCHKGVEQVRFQTGPEDNCGRCRGDVFRQTVPDTSSDWRSSVTDGRQSSAADDQ